MAIAKTQTMIFKNYTDNYIWKTMNSRKNWRWTQVLIKNRFMIPLVTIHYRRSIMTMVSKPEVDPGVASQIADSQFAESQIAESN